MGDDIAWMKFDSNGQLRAINPENGFFGVAPGMYHVGISIEYRIYYNCVLVTESKISIK